MIALRVLIASSLLTKDLITTCLWKSFRSNSGKKEREMIFGGKCDKERTYIEFVETCFELNRFFFSFGRTLFSSLRALNSVNNIFSDGVGKQMV